MLCTLCQHGVTSKIGDKPTGATWACPCGEINCRHIDVCQCGRTLRRKYKVGDAFRLLLLQIDHDESDNERVTPAGSIVEVSYIAAENTCNPYVVSCPANGASWFFSDGELEREAELIAATRPPAQGDYLGLGGERHTTIDAIGANLGNGTWLVSDDHGEDFRVKRDPGNDNEIRYAWKLA